MTGPSAREQGRHFEGFRDPEHVEEGGVINISGNFLLDHKDEVLNLVKHEGKLSEERHPKRKVLSIDEADGKIVVKTSEHNLALHIGKALEHAYKGTHTYKFLKEEKYVEVDWRRD
jgi:hypothetical protein